MNYSRSNYSRSPRKRRGRYLLILLVLLLLAVVLWFFLYRDKAEAPQNTQTPVESNSQNQTPAYQPVDLQPTIDAWVAKQAADYHIQVYDHQAKKIIGSNDPEEVLFAASLYKIYVAYLALLDFQTGKQNPNDILIAGQTKRQCVDKMIRSSDSPCGEAMMAEIGQSTLNQRVKDMGMTGTFFNGIRTSAQDSALILQHLLNNRDLSAENTAFLLDAMLAQDAKFKRGLQTGAPAATWNTKVGWNENINYHDIGIMTMPDGRKFAVAILGQGSGASAPIADFAKTIYAALN